MIHVVIGTRAQLIKMAPLLHELESRRLPVNLILTGQHSVTMDELLADFEVTTEPRTLYHGPEIGGVLQMVLWMTRCLWRLWGRRRDWFAPGGGAPAGVVLVHGDTASTLLGVLAGRLAGLQVAHVECGLRSFRMFHPFPEELTRRWVMRLVHVGYCPGAWAASNAAGVVPRVVDTQHNTLLDSVRWALARPGASSSPASPYFVASIHRFENLVSARRFGRILSMLEQLTVRARCVFVLHPVTESRLARVGALEALRRNARFTLVPRMAFTAFVRLLAGAHFVVTDGGSNQEELAYLGIPAVLMRAATERQDGLGGSALLSQYDPVRIGDFLDHRLAAPGTRIFALPEARPCAQIGTDLAAMLGGS